ncbi:hypothetical protein SAMN04487949_1443 [Halogranum gelatinilyticum]|uniref:Uncharacterized protein n=1 Tax=Halogranum gelatinilyticum TaxID=660521 RepID=A0A1G9SPH9_9EURY|nr:hypothetical protein [Halogranum gelatinilyticum]SDM37332.1 hypothetical protein SAMN04487949_1443 [Halogranum gelatinilyticum]
MNRRHALLSLASLASAASVGLAGCLSRGQSGSVEASDPSSGSGSDTGDREPATSDGSAMEPTYDLPDPPFRGMRAEPMATVAVGAQTGTATATPGTHVVQLWNDGENARRLTVRITGEETGVQFDETLDVTPGDHLDFAFQTADAYTVEVTGSDYGAQASVDRDWDECSTSVTTIRLHDGGSEIRGVTQSGDCTAANA